MGTIVKIADMVTKTTSELYDLLGDLKKEMLNLRIQQKVHQTQNVKRTRECRKDVARAKTRLSQLKKSV